VSAGTNPDPGDLADIPEEEKLAALKYLIDEDFVEVVEREDGLYIRITEQGAKLA
jgi:hypothetical protein